MSRSLRGLNAGELIAAIKALPNPYAAQAAQRQASAPQPARQAAPQQPNLNQFLGANSTSGVLGANAFNRAIESGLSEQQVRNLAAQQGLSIGAGVQSNSRPAVQQPVQTNSLNQFLGANSTAGTIGASAFNRALASGLTDQQIRSQAAAQGLSIGAGVPMAQAVAAEQVSKFNKDKGLAFNLKAAGNTLSAGELQRLQKITGQSQDKILEKAVQKGLSIGSKVINQYQSDTTFPKVSFDSPKGGTIVFDPLSKNPILKQIRDAGKVDKGSKVFIGSKGSTATVLPRNSTPSGSNPRTTRPVQAEAPVTLPETLPITEMMPLQQEAFNFDDFLNQLAGPMDEPAMPSMPQLESFENISSDFDINDPLQFASLGQSYLTEAIRAARRRAQTRRDYMRNMMMMSMMQGMNPLSIGGGLNVG